MLEQNSTVRNIKADQSRVNAFKSKIGAFSIFSSEELRVILKYLRPHLYKVTFLVLFTVAISVLESAKALTIVAFIKSLFSDNSNLGDLAFINKFKIVHLLPTETKGSLIIVVFVIFIALSMASVIVNYFASYLLRDIQLSLMRGVRNDLYSKIVSFDIDFFDQAKSGELLFMMNTEVNRFTNLLLYSKIFVSSIFTFLFLLGALFYMSPLITSAIALFSIFFLFFHQKAERKLKMISWQLNAHESSLQQMFYNIIYGIKLIKLGGLEEREKEEYLKFHHRFEHEYIRQHRLQLLAKVGRESYSIMLIILFSCALFYFLSHGILKWENSFVLSYLFVLMKTLPSFASIQTSMLSFIEAHGPLKNIVNILTKPSAIQNNTTYNNSPSLNPVNKIELRNIFFSYKAQNDVLKSINLSFHKGKLYGIVGFSGGGKSTLLDLISGIKKPKKGTVSFNGIDSERISPIILKEKFGYMNQEPLIFHDSIIENMTFFNRDVTSQEIDQALDKAALKEFVDSLENKLETGLGERGVTVSGGERQRIGLSRVFLKNSEVLLLDEATNALDYKTERHIYDNLRKVKDNKIIIVVAHRLTSIVYFDESIVLHDGQVIEVGSHEYLMNKKGVYYSLFTLQYKTRQHTSTPTATSLYE